MANYKLDNADVMAMLNGVKSYGQAASYELLLQQAIDLMKESETVDDGFMDMYDKMLAKARASESEKKREEIFRAASILRTIAHDIHRMYLRKDKEDRNNKRFLRLVK